MIHNSRRALLPGIVSVVLVLMGLVGAPAQATGTGTLGVSVTGRYTAGHSSPLTGATVVAENLDTGTSITLVTFGDPNVSAYYQALGVPYGRYRVRIAHPGFATTYWPRQLTPESAGVVWFGTSPGCNPSDGALCDTHLLSPEVQQLVSVSGSVRHRSGATAPGVLVTAQHTEEATFRPAVVTGVNGGFSMQVPPGTYSLHAPNGNRTSQTSVTVTGPTVRDLTLLDPPSAPLLVIVATGNRQATVTWQTPLDDGGTPITSYSVAASPGSSICTTSALSCTVPGLENGREYRFSVTAHNAVGSGPAGGTSGATSPSASVPAPPGDVTVEPADRALAVGWSASTSDDVLDYTAIATPGGRSCTSAAQSCTITGLRNGNAYSVAVTARSQGGVSAAATSLRKVKPIAVPSAPRNIRVRPRPSALRVRWGAPLDDGGKRIREYVATVWPGGKTCRTDARTCLIRGLDPGTDYSVTVRAGNASGLGVSSPGSVPTRPRPGQAVPGPVAGLRVRVHKGRANITWQASERATTYLVRLKDPGRRATGWSVVRRPKAAFVVTPGVHRVQVRASGESGPGKTRSRVFRSP